MEVSASAWARDSSLHPESGSPWTSRKCNSSFQKDIARDNPYSWSFPPSCLNTCNKMSSAAVLTPEMQAYEVWPIHWIEEVSILFLIQPTVTACSWGAPLSFFQGLYIHYRLTLAQFGPINRTVCSEHAPRKKNFFLSGQNWGLDQLFGRFASSLMTIRASMQLLSFLLWTHPESVGIASLQPWPGKCGVQ